MSRSPTLNKTKKKKGNRIITPEEFTRDVMKAMAKAEANAGLPRGSIVKAWVEEWNNHPRRKNDLP